MKYYISEEEKKTMETYFDIKDHHLKKREQFILSHYCVRLNASNEVNTGAKSSSFLKGGTGVKMSHVKQCSQLLLT